MLGRNRGNISPNEEDRSELHEYSKVLIQVQTNSILMMPWLP